jgi:predicted flavoprotein YhiN
MAAEILGRAGVSVTVYDRMPSVGRKFLMAGRGGLNLTHSEPFDRFTQRYAEAQPHLLPVLEAFRPEDLRAWCEGLGQETFVGSSGRVFPKTFKASPLLRAWLARLERLGVRFVLRHRWEGWDREGRLVFTGPSGETLRTETDATVLALGGASWPRLGSAGAGPPFWPGGVSPSPPCDPPIWASSRPGRT